MDLIITILPVVTKDLPISPRGGGGGRAVRARKAIEVFSCSDGQPVHAISRENGLNTQCGCSKKIEVVNMAELSRSTIWGGAGI